MGLSVRTQQKQTKKCFKIHNLIPSDPYTKNKFFNAFWELLTQLLNCLSNQTQIMGKSFREIPWFTVRLLLYCPISFIFVSLSLIKSDFRLYSINQQNVS